MSYKRELPRDLYNEANLLKCMARVCQWINDEQAPGLEFRHETYDEHRERETPGFEVGGDADGETFVMNVKFTLRGKKVEFWRPLNARSAWPLKFHYCDEGDDDEVYYEDDDDAITEEGEMTPEFHALIYGD